MDKFPIEIVKEIISYCSDEIKYKLCNRYRWYDMINNVDQMKKRRFVEFNCINLVRHFGVPFDGWAMFYAAMNGNLEMIELLFRLGTDWHPAAVQIATSRGHMDVVRWLHHYQPDHRNLI